MKKLKLKRTLPEPMRFDGPEYSPKLDQIRLTGQIKRIYDLMIDSRWRTLGEIAQETYDPEASISAQLRHLRKARFGAHIVEKRRRGDEKQGLYEYKLTVNNLPVQQKLF
ncbi:MAG: hypothetical protein ACW964_13675 [Candidatus Hodarchaeales archaeon]